MDDARFDAWTRRRFGRAAGGLLTALIGLGTAEQTAAKHHHKPKKCKKTETKCGKKCVKGTCCPHTDCGLDCGCVRAVEGDTFCTAKNALVSCEQCKTVRPARRDSAVRRAISVSAARPCVCRRASDRNTPPPGDYSGAVGIARRAVAGAAWPRGSMPRCASRVKETPMRPSGLPRALDRFGAVPLRIVPGQGCREPAGRARSDPR